MSLLILVVAGVVLIWLVVGVVAGFLAGVIVKGFGFGLVGNLIVGVVGAVLAGCLLPVAGVTFILVSPLVTSTLHATLGAVALLLLLGLLRRAAREETDGI